ncbi:MAG: hypothetical protein KW788_03995 [Candidatus Doudnabacteria bacterium]|nr:hypothetical protein [Candidatus Doudnabacteria bacterium]
MDDQILDPQSFSELPHDLVQPQALKPWYKNYKIVGPLGIVVLIILGVGLYYLLGGNSGITPSSKQVGLIIKGPETLAAGSEAQYTITYHNGENADLLNVHLDLIYPSNFQFKSSTPTAKLASGQSFDLPMVKEGKEGQVTIRGKLSGSTGEDKPILAKLHYKLSNFNSTFEVDQTFHTTIQAPKLTLEISGPAEVPIGQDSTFTVNYSNVSGADYDNLALSLVYPENFKFALASVPPTKNNNFWQIGKLANGNSGHIDIKGTFLGENLDEQLITGMLGQTINGTFAAQIISTATFHLKNAPLSLDQESSPGEMVNLGDSVQFTIKYENTSSVGLTNLVITDTFASNLVDTSKISVSDAIIAGSTVIWKAATNRNLSLLTPGQKGQVQFSLPLKQSLPATLKNQLIKNSVTITSAEITTPIQASDIELKLTSRLVFDVVGDYISGAQPMQVGKSSTFAITFLLSNGSNDITDALVTAALPLPSSAWTGVVVPESEKSRLHFDPDSGLIRWEVPLVPAFSGKLTPATKVTFNLTVTPSASDQGQVIRFLTDIQASGTDSFTSAKLTPQTPSQFTSSDLSDDQFQSVESTVQ